MNDTTFASLSAAERNLVRLMQSVSNGRLMDIPVRDGQPVLAPTVKVVRRVTLLRQRPKTDRTQPPEPTTSDFVLRQEVMDLLSQIRRTHVGMIERLEVLHGLPTIVEFAHPLTGVTCAPDDLDPYISNLIRHRARRLAHARGFRSHDEEDLRQELALHVIDRFRRYDPERSTLHTYADRILTNKVRDLVRRAHAAKHDLFREELLDDHPARTLDELEEKSWGYDEHLYRRVELSDALDLLPVFDRDVALSLADDTVAAVARRRGLSRQNVRSARQRVRRHLQQCGVGL